MNATTRLDGEVSPDIWGCPERELVDRAAGGLEAVIGILTGHPHSYHVPYNMCFSLTERLQCIASRTDLDEHAQHTVIGPSNVFYTLPCKLCQTSALAPLRSVHP